MLCQMCKSREATTKIFLSHGVIPVETCLCSDCEKRVSSKNIFTEKYSKNFWGSESPEIRCEICKTTLSDFEETLYVGCENCYRVFAREVSKHALELNGKNVYVGKIPPKLINRISRSAEIKQLTRRYNDCLVSGDIDEAKKLRAKILSIGGIV